MRTNMGYSCHSITNIKHSPYDISYMYAVLSKSGSELCSALSDLTWNDSAAAFYELSLLTHNTTNFLSSYKKNGNKLYTNLFYNTFARQSLL